MGDKVCIERSDLHALHDAARRAYGPPADPALIDRTLDLLYPPPELVDLFEQFWLAYGRKVDRKPARKAWDRMVKAGVDPCMVIEAARAYRQFCLEPNTPNQKNPATWLNAESWENELEAWSQPTRHEKNRVRLVAGTQVLSLADRLAAIGVQPAIGG